MAAWNDLTGTSTADVHGADTTGHAPTYDSGRDVVSAQIRVAVIGAGSWGTTVAAIASANTPTTLWARRPELAEQINSAHVNADYLASFALPRDLRATAVDRGGGRRRRRRDHGGAVARLPRGAVEAAPFLRPWVPIVSLSKGIEPDTLLRMTEVASEEMPGRPVGVLTGPNLAKEIMAGQPAASVVAIPTRRSPPSCSASSRNRRCACTPTPTSSAARSPASSRT